MGQLQGKSWSTNLSNEFFDPASLDHVLHLLHCSTQYLMGFNYKNQGVFTPYTYTTQKFGILQTTSTCLNGVTLAYSTILDVSVVVFVVIHTMCFLASFTSNNCCFKSRAWVWIIGSTCTMIFTYQSFGSSISMRPLQFFSCPYLLSANLLDHL